MEGVGERKHDGGRNSAGPCRLRFRPYTEHRYRHGLTHGTQPVTAGSSSEAGSRRGHASARLRVRPVRCRVPAVGAGAHGCSATLGGSAGAIDGRAGAGTPAGAGAGEGGGRWSSAGAGSPGSRRSHRGVESHACPGSGRSAPRLAAGVATFGDAVVGGAAGGRSPIRTSARARARRRLGVGGPSRVRTCDLRIKSPQLYQLSYRPEAPASLSSPS
jgi:hypothetical protein